MLRRDKGKWARRRAPGDLQLVRGAGRHGAQGTARGAMRPMFEERQHGAAGHARHTSLGFRSVAPPAISVPRNNGIDIAAQAIFRWSFGTYPGLHKGLRQIFKGKPALETIRDWRRGRRPTPQWARDLLLAAIDNQRAALDHARAILERESKEKGAD